MSIEKVLDNIISDVRTELLEEYGRNFRRKAFFNERWARRKYNDGKGSLMIRSGALMKSLRARRSARGLTFYSNLAYASIHNDGGEIKVTRQMKRYFWAMYYKYAGKVKILKSGKRSRSKSSLSNNATAEFYKALALKKVGSTIKIPQRQFLGNAPQVEVLIREIVTSNINAFLNEKENIFGNH